MCIRDRGLAQRIVRGDVPENLKDRIVFSLDMGCLLYTSRDYVEYLEKAVGCKITYISVGAEREAYIHHV